MSELTDQSKLVALLGMLVVLLFACLVGYGGYVAVQKSQKPSTLPVPTREVRPSPENLSLVLAIAVRSEPAGVERFVTVPYEDVRNFKDHLSIAATQRGWFLYEPNHYSAYLVIPAEELPVLDLLEADPVGWVTAESSRQEEPRGPSTLNLVKVSLEIDPDGITLSNFWAILGIFGVVAGGGLAASLAVYWIWQAYEAWRGREGATTRKQAE